MKPLTNKQISELQKADKCLKRSSRKFSINPTPENYSIYKADIKVIRNLEAKIRRRTK